MVQKVKLSSGEKLSCNVNKNLDNSRALLSIGSVLTDPGLFSRPFGQFGFVMNLFFCQKGLFLLQIGIVMSGKEL